MEALNADTVLHIATTPEMQQTLACCSWHLRCVLASTNAAARHLTKFNVIWLNREVHVKLFVNPITARLVWSTGNFIREAWIMMKTARSVGSFTIDGIPVHGGNFHLKNVDVRFRWYSLTGMPCKADVVWDGAAAVFMTQYECEIVIRNGTGLRPRLMNGKKTVVFTCGSTWTMYNDILFATTSPAFTELHALPVMTPSSG